MDEFHKIANKLCNFIIAAGVVFLILYTIIAITDSTYCSF